MFKKIILWIMWTFIRGFEMIGISVAIIGFVLIIVGLASALIWWGCTNGEYLILVGIVASCIFMFGIIYRFVGRII